MQCRTGIRNIRGNQEADWVGRWTDAVDGRQRIAARRIRRPAQFVGGTAYRNTATLWREGTLAAIPVGFAIGVLITKLKTIGVRFRDGCETDVTSRTIIGLIGTAAVFHRTEFRFFERSQAGADRLGVCARIGALLATGAGAPLAYRIAWG